MVIRISPFITLSFLPRGDRESHLYGSAAPGSGINDRLATEYARPLGEADQAEPAFARFCCFGRLRNEPPPIILNRDLQVGGIFLDHYPSLARLRMLYDVVEAFLNYAIEVYLLFVGKQLVDLINLGRNANAG